MLRTSISNVIFSVGIVAAIVVFLNLAYRIEVQDLEETYREALSVATRDATSVLIDVKSELAVNSTYDGYTLEKEDLPIDFDGVLKQFYLSLWSNLPFMNEQEQETFKAHIPIKGIIGYQAIYINLWDDTWLPPISYTYYDTTVDTLYRFTLGERVWFRETYSGNEGWTDISSISVPTGDLTNEQFRDYIIMKTINEELSRVASSEFNITAMNLQRGIKFQLPHFDKTVVDGNDIYFNAGNIFEEPGMFALIDGITFGYDSIPKPIATFGGSQLKYIE